MLVLESTLSTLFQVLEGDIDIHINHMADNIIMIIVQQTIR